MINFLFKTGTYIFIWKKFKTQIISISFSLFFVWLIFGIYDDLIRIFDLSSRSLLYLLVAKWLIVSLIIFFNIFIFKISKNKLEDIGDDNKINLPLKSQEVLQKESILTTTDLILKKYKGKK